MMTNDLPSVSVVIPTHNRYDSLCRTLDSLQIQTYPLHQVEVVVVADGCTDATATLLKSYDASFFLKIVEQPGSGPAAARNNGAELATGQILIFLDDDIEASPELIEEYVLVHQHCPNKVAIGYLPPVLNEQKGFFRVVLRMWWENMFYKMHQPGYRYAYSDLLSGNFSVEAQLFQEVGGFNTTLWCHEDFELGLRLLKTGADFIFVPKAQGYHHEITNVGRALKRKYEEGKADVMIGRLHPELRPVTPLVNIGVYYGKVDRLMQNLAFAKPTLGDLVATGLMILLDIFEKMRLRGRWGNLLDRMLGYWYWRGVASELGAKQAVFDFLQSNVVISDGNSSNAEIELDLRNGLVEAEQSLDETRPASARVYYDDYTVGYIPARPGTERLRGVHLRSALANDLAWPLLMALVVEQATTKQNALGDPLLTQFSISPEVVYANQGG